MATRILKFGARWRWLSSPSATPAKIAHWTEDWLGHKLNVDYAKNRNIYGLCRE